MVPNGSNYTPFPSFADAGTRTEPDSAKYSQGFVPGDTYPAEWANYFLHGATAGISRLNDDTDSIKKELNSILSAYGITNDATVYDQLLNALYKIYPQICTCSTAAATETKAVSLTGNVLRAGCVYSITMTYANTYGNGSSTYPKLAFNSGTAYPMCDSKGKYLKTGAWAAGDVVTVLFTGAKFLMATSTVDKIENGNKNAATSHAVSCVIASSTTITGAPAIGTGGTVKILFTSALTASNTTTALAISYNGTSYTLKANKDGSLVNIYAKTINGSTKYLQANTLLELVYDGTNLIVTNNPVVLSGNLYKVYANGKIGDEPVGTVKPWPASSIPYGWEKCEHKSLSRTTYADLYGVIGTTYGSKNASEFYLPDYRETALVGVGTNDSDSIGTHDSFTLGQFKDDRYKAHYHELNYEGVAWSTSNGTWDSGDCLWPCQYYGSVGYRKPRGMPSTTEMAGSDTTRTKEKGVIYIIKVMA